MSDPVPSPGQQVRVRFTKWGGLPHWEYDSVVLGQDAYGVWVGGRVGSRMSRPGVTVDVAADYVQCIPLDRGHAATFWAEHGEPLEAEVYVDITTVARWVPSADGRPEVTMVDLDLDVVRRFDQTLYVDDEDEFAEHQVSYGYPSEVIAAAEAECRSVHRAMVGADEPYATVGRGWLTGYGRTSPA